MKKTIKIICAILLLASSYIFGSIYVMSDDISDNYKLNYGDELKIDTFMPVTVVYNGVEVSKDVTRNIGESFEVDLKLFGIIPFSKTNVQIVDDMHVKVLGEPFGMKIYTDGVLVIDSTDIAVTKGGNQNPAKKAGIKVGDYIKSINGQKVTSNEDVLDIVTESDGKTLKFEVVRDKKSFYCNVTPVLDKESDVYRIGIWVRDSSAGIGTLTFYSPSNDVICGLGHGICDNDTEVLLDINEGELVKANIIDVQKGASGSPGALKGKLTYDSIADVSLNCESGVYGIATYDIATSDLTEVALKQDVKNGAAQILCTVDGNTPKLYSCKIKKIGKSDSPTQNLIVTVTDEELIKATGGIVQGMSGSPILQDGKLVGALTHVLVDDSKTGYGIYAENMLEVANSVGNDIRVIPQKQAS